ncbi:MAG: hypothetical protein ABR955_08295 [Verrucomicrobiota bacterium]
MECILHEASQTARNAQKTAPHSDAECNRAPSKSFWAKSHFRRGDEKNSGYKSSELLKASDAYFIAIISRNKSSTIAAAMNRNSLRESPFNFMARCASSRSFRSARLPP